MRKILLSRDQTALLDEKDYRLVSGYNWLATWNKGTQSYYAFANLPKVNGRQQRIYMHRLILGLEIGDKRRALHVDSRQSLDNRRSNLFIAGKGEGNLQSRRGPNSLGVKGVWLHEGRYYARTKVNGKQISLGGFDTKELAGNAVTDAEKKYRPQTAIDSSKSARLSHPCTHFS